MPLQRFQRFDSVKDLVYLDFLEAFESQQSFFLAWFPSSVCLSVRPSVRANESVLKWLGLARVRVG